MSPATIATLIPFHQYLWPDGVSGALSAFVEGGAALTISAVSYFALKFGGFLLGIAGTLFNWVMLKAVFEFSTLIGNSPGLIAAWTILRDIGNMMLLFGFIFVGIAIILELHSYPAKKTLPRLIIFAILMNFSLFIAEAVVDVSNGASAMLYKQSGVLTCPGVGNGELEGSGDTSTGTAQTIDCAVNYGISGHIMQSTGLSSTFGEESIGITVDMTRAVIQMGLAMFVTIGAIVLFAASIMLIIRAVVLTFLIILAPLGFAAMAIPPLEKAAKDWWSRLIHQSFFAPILLLLILISLTIADGIATSESQQSLVAALVEPGVSTTGVIFSFALIIGFLIFSLIAAKKFGAMGADFFIGAATAVVKSPITASRSIGGVVGRNTVGRGSAKVQKGYNQLMARKPKGRIGQFAQGALKLTGADKGIVDTLEKGQKAKFGTGSSFKDKKEWNKTRKKELTEVGRQTQNENDLRTSLNMTGSDRDAKIAEVLDRMSIKEIEELDEIKKSGATLDLIAKNLSSEKFAALMKDGSGLDEGQKGNAREARFRDLENALATLVAPGKSADEISRAKEAIREIPSKDLQHAPPHLLSDSTFTETISDSQRDDLIKSGGVSPTVRNALRAADPVERVKSAYRDIKEGAEGAPSITVVQDAIKKMNPKKAAKLSARMLTDKDIAKVLTINQLRGIAKEDKLDEPDRKVLASHILDRTGGEPELDNHIRDPKNGTFAAYYNPHI